jgi:anti-sigma regulatory factor (Ser/Thr protein kinase)
LYQMKTGVNCIEGIFSADLANVDRLMKSLRLYMEKHHLEKESFGCELVAREALNNAVVHVSGEDRQNKIRFLMEFGTHDITMKFSDEGHGFDWRKYISKEYDQKGTSGRGILLLKLYTSEFLYNEKGNEILITIPRHLPEG